MSGMSFRRGNQKKNIKTLARCWVNLGREVSLTNSLLSYAINLNLRIKTAFKLRRKKSKTM